MTAAVLSSRPAEQHVLHQILYALLDTAGNPYPPDC